VAKASPEKQRHHSCDSVIFDLRLWTPGLLSRRLSSRRGEEERFEKGRAVYVVGATGTTFQRIRKFDVRGFCPLKRVTLPHSCLKSGRGQAEVRNAAPGPR